MALLPLLQWLDQRSTLLTLLLIVILVVLRLLRQRRTPAMNSKLPPSPSKLPIIGNLHQLGNLPHRSLRYLSQKHGPLMFLQLGHIPTIVVSSPKIAQQIMKTHDLDFANRPALSSARKLLYDCKDVSFAPYGEYWRQVRKICILELLSGKRVKSFGIVRGEEMGHMIEKICRSCSGSTAIDISKMFLSLTNGIVCRVAFGRKYHEERESGHAGLVELTKELTVLLGAFHVGDFFPSFKWIDVFTGLDCKVRKTSRGLDEFLDLVIEDHMDPTRDEMEYKDFVDVLLLVQKEHMLDLHLTKDDLKGVLLDMFAGGTDTTSTALEWAMAELVKNPKAMKKAQTEVREIAGGKLMVEESDINQMEYLRSVIKETLRLHPPLPLLIPRESIKTTEIQGYVIPAKTRILVNAWAIGRDPESWERPEEFLPERFIHSPIDFKGQDFQLIPFGGGRRSCPGLSFAVATIELILANLLHRFDWEVPDNANVEDLDMNEISGLTVHKKHPLLLLAKPHLE